MVGTIVPSGGRTFLGESLRNNRTRPRVRRKIDGGLSLIQSCCSILLFVVQYPIFWWFAFTFPENIAVLLSPRNKTSEHQMLQIIVLRWRLTEQAIDELLPLDGSDLTRSKLYHRSLKPSCLIRIRLPKIFLFLYRFICCTNKSTIPHECKMYRTAHPIKLLESLMVAALGLHTYKNMVEHVFRIALGRNDVPYYGIH